jgi:cysteine-rich repeat protein
MALLLSCSGGSTLITGGDDAQDVNRAEAAAEVSTVDVVEVAAELPDLAVEEQVDLGTGCEPGTGCFLEPCTDGKDCLSGICVEHMGDNVCTDTCVEECPQGWDCQQISTGGPDLQFACVSPYTHLCRPCKNSGDCKSASGIEDVCVDYGAAGRFCGARCDSGQCPFGFACKDAVTAEGSVLKQCVSDSGLCSCSKKSIELGLSTVCFVENDLGECAGTRTCGPDGLSACDAQEPQEEQCNGLDDDCNGEVDDVSCDDGNGCTKDECDAEAGCVHEALSGTSCEDGDVCTLADHCESGECLGTSINCNDDNVCTTDECDPTGGCKYSFNKADCDDEDPCTVSDVCSQGKCSGFAVACDCKTSTDCLALEDGDACNGKLVCDTKQLPHKCVVDIKTVVECPVPKGVGAECLGASCDPLSGKCSFVPAGEGKACSDGDACTFAETCAEGVCKGGKPVNCNDGNSCTDDLCDALTGCKFTPNSAACEDGNPCTLADQCAGGSCVSGKAQDCNDGNVCTDDSCDPAKGCVHLFNQVPCSDSNECTTGDVCKLGTCVSTGVQGCNDGNVCTDDSCDPAAGCKFAFNQIPCNDANKCTTGDVCKQGLCQGSSLLPCDDGNVCTDDSCDPEAGCVHKNNAATCDDGNVCTTTDLCKAGTCKGNVALDCNDGNLCTDDLCDPAKGCVHLDNKAPCDDGNPCTGSDSCSGGQCKGGPAVVCNDGNPCTTDSCDPKGGCVYSPNSDPCDDGNKCTTTDKCSAGKCVGSGTLACGDDNVCTDDSCDPGLGCTHTLNTAPCDDGDFCTVGDKCTAGGCKPAQWLTCDDGNLCTADACDPKTGCTHTPAAGGCNDKNACTTGDTCQDGTCVGTGWVSCDDSNVCTTDTCLPKTGCQHVNNTVPCNDANACTVTDLCANGKCTGSGNLACNDGNICTDDSCDPGSGCVYSPNTVGCNDGNACTDGDTCGGGTCKPGAGVTCNDGNKCTTDSCDPATGCKYTPITPCCGNSQVEAGEACDDGNAISGDGCENNCTLSTPTVPGFSGELGPVFGGAWVQCEGYLDKPGGDDIPKTWGNDCTGAAYGKIRLVCGADKNNYRYIDVSKNLFKDGLGSYQVNGLIYGSNFSGWVNEIYADGNHPHTGVSWWGGPWGCSETASNVTINNSCGWEASNCFAQNIGGNRYLWVYVAP